jgi:hypothetical protein
MSVLFLDELPLVHMETFYLRLIDMPFYETGFSNASLIPGPVGTLPLDQFIYCIVGALAIIFCIIGNWASIQAMRHPKTKIPPSLGTPPYKTRRPPVAAVVSTIVRDELGRHRTDSRYPQPEGSYPEPSLLAKPNLPIPVVQEVPDSENSGDGMGLQNIGEWENLVKEKAKLNITITHLQRIAQARSQSGEVSASKARLRAALERRAKVQNLINAAYERFKERKETWSGEEWEVVELIMKYSDHSTV